MHLNGRVARLEDTARSRRIAEPCRWDGPLVIYPPTLPRGEDGRVILPPCEAPATCPGPTSARIFLPGRRPA
jgi:hypothetical protein